MVSDIEAAQLEIARLKTELNAAFDTAADAVTEYYLADWGDQSKPRRARDAVLALKSIKTEGAA